MNLLILLILAAVILFAAITAIRRFRHGSACCGEHETIRRNGPRYHGRSYPYKVSVRIGGMTCSNCAVKVENAINQLDGYRACVHIDSGKADISSVNPPDSVQIKQAVRQAGYVVLS